MIAHPLIQKDVVTLTSVSKILDNTRIADIISKSELQIIVQKLAKKGGFNVLNVSDEAIVANGGYDNFWDNFNLPWLQKAITRGDDIWAASNPLELNLLFKDLSLVPINSLQTPEALANYIKTLSDPAIINQLTGFGKEVQALSKNGYI